MRVRHGRNLSNTKKENWSEMYRSALLHLNARSTFPPLSSQNVCTSSFDLTCLSSYLKFWWEMDCVTLQLHSAFHRFWFGFFSAWCLSCLFSCKHRLRISVFSPYWAVMQARWSKLLHPSPEPVSWMASNPQEALWNREKSIRKRTFVTNLIFQITMTTSFI